jgi:hypothetical protein
MQLSSEALVGAFALHAEKNGSGSLAHRSELKAARERGGPLLDDCEYDDAVFRAFRLIGRDVD